MASAQVQHDGPVIGSVVAARFFTSQNRTFRARPNRARPLPRRAHRSTFLSTPNSTATAPNDEIWLGRNCSEAFGFAQYFHKSLRCSKILPCSVLISILKVKNLLKPKITEYSVVVHISNKMFQPEIIWLCCPIHASL